MAMRVSVLAANHTKRPTALEERLDAHAADCASRAESQQRCSGLAGMLAIHFVQFEAKLLRIGFV